VKVFVTGGTGLIGRRVIAALVRRGDAAVCVTRSASRARSRLAAGVEILEADPTLEGSWQDGLAGCDAVVNLAGDSVGEGYWTEGKKRQLRRSRLSTTQNVVDAIGRSGSVRVLVSASATGYYGDGGEQALNESREPGVGFLARLAREWEATALQAESRCRVVLLRIGVVLDRYGGALPRLSLPFKFGLGGPLGGGRQYLPWIHIDDLTRAVLFALDEEELRGPVNAVAPDPPTQRTFARELGAALGRPAILPAPAFLLRALLGEKADMLLASQRAVPAALRARGFQFEHDSLPSALADLLV
jgi:uncharacterized protein (TIGR01777 family)